MARQALFAAALALLALPVLAAASADPLADAAAAIERGDGVSAEVAARRALEAGRPAEAVAAYLGEAAMLQDDPDEARRWLGEGRFDAASAGRGFHALGRLELEAGDFRAASLAFDRALQAGGDARLWVDIGRMRYRGGEQHLAGDAVARALELDPREPQALMFQAELVRDSQGLAAALPWFERAVRLAPKDLGLLGEYAATLGELGRYKDMLAVARRMAAIDRGHPKAYLLQAVLAARAGQDELAQRLLLRTDGAYAEQPAAMLLEGVLEYRSGHAALAIDKFAELARRQPDNAIVARLLGRALLADGDAGEVVARYAPRAGQANASPYMLTLVGRAYEQLGRRDLAAPYLDRAARPGPHSIVARAAGEAGELAIYRWGDDPTRGEVAAPMLRKMLSEGRSADAAAYAARLSARYPGSADIEVLVGDAALVAGDTGRALASYGAAAQVRRTAALADRIAAAKGMLGDAEGAEATLAAYLAQHPLDRGIAARLGREAARQGDWPRAAGLLGRAAALPGGDRDAALLADLAEARLRTGDGQGALASARRSYRVQRASPRATAVLAAALAATGGRNAAEVLLAKARQTGGDTALARR